MAISTPTQVSKIQQASAATIDRVQASKLLKVSVRTVDRYIKNGKIPAYQKNGRIWLKKSDVIEFGKGSLVMINPLGTENHSPIRGTGARTAPSVHEINAALHSALPNGSVDATFYKDLYEEAQKRLNDFQHKYEQATQRMGDLEAHIVRLNNQTQATITQPAITRQLDRQDGGQNERFELELMKKELITKDKDFSELKSMFDKEKTSKAVFALLTYVLLALQPVFWYFLR